MGRPRTFDKETVLDRALDVFWAQGYAATSVQDLVDAMDINRASLYNTFGGKHALYMAALRRYEEQWTTELLDTLEGADDALGGLRALLESVADDAADCPKRGSCLLTNAATELGHRDADTAERVTANFRRVEDALQETIERGQAAGDIPAEADARALARCLLNGLQGLRVLARTRPDRDALQDIVDTLVAAARTGATTAARSPDRQEREATA